MSNTTLKVEPGQALTINAPQIFADPEFIAWLNNGNPKFTWHKGGQPSDWSDVVVLVDPGLTGEGSDDMPSHIWSQLVEVCRSNLVATRNMPHIMVRLTNLD